MTRTASDAMEHRTWQGEGGAIHYWVARGGPRWIAFTHGACMDHDLFAPQVERFAGAYSVLVWDVPGHGRSRPYRGLSLRGAARELLAMLAAEGADDAHLVGQSMGGYIAQLAVREAPERVRSVTAVDSSPIQPRYYSGLDRRLLRWTPALLRLYPEQALLRAIAGQVAVTEEGRAYARAVLATMAKAEVAAIMAAVARGLAEVTDDAPLPVPVLIVYGEADRTGRVRDYCCRWERAEGRPTAVLPKAGHNANMDSPAAFNAAVAGFLTEVDAG
jgi:pimeloyl-ACP methyl ester carboxylesterase